MKRLIFMAMFLALGCCAFAPNTANAQGVLIAEESARLPRPDIIIIRPIPPRPPVLPAPTPVRTLEYKISEIRVDAKLTDQIAEVQVAQSFVNTGSTQMEVSFMFPLPYDGAIDQLTLMVDGKEFPGTLMEADKARTIYEGIVRQNKDPALLEWVGTGMFRTSVFPVPAGATRTVTLKYTQLCKRTDGLTDFLFPLSTAKYTTKPVEKIAVNLMIESADAIRNVYSPSQDIKVEKTTEKLAKITWEVTNIVPAADFRLLYDVGNEKLTTKVLSYRPKTDDEGFFMLLASPEIKKTNEKPLPKTVFFVVDNSGSMSGQKIVQVREAVKFVLNNLREGDTFNIMTYNSTTRLFKDAMQTFNDATRKEGLAFAEGIYAGGGTNIDDALTRTLKMLDNADDKNPKYVFFLTDGCPTVGERNEMKIVENARKANTVKARIFAFGAGYDLNSRLLDKLVNVSSGQSEFVKPDEDIEERISRLYNKLEAPVMTDVRLAFTPEEGSEAAKNTAPLVNRVYPADGFDIFAGEQLVISGRYKYPGKGTLKITGKIGDGVTQEFTYPLELVVESPDARYAFAEKLWAIRRIGEIIDELDLSGRNEEIMKELVELSTKHGIMTPYTSFLADENARFDDRVANVRRAESRVQALADNTENALGVRQRAMKGGMRNAMNAAPAFMPADEEAADFDTLAGVVAAEKSAEMAPAASPGHFAYSPAAPARGAAISGRAHGGAGGYGGAVGYNPAADAKREQVSIQQNVRNIQNRTFFYKENQWVDTSMTETQQKAAPRNVKQFSDEYFELVKKYGQDITPFLVFDEPVLLCVADEVILVEP